MLFLRDAKILLKYRELNLIVKPNGWMVTPVLKRPQVHWSHRKIAGLKS